MVEQRTSIAAADPYLLFGLLGKRVIHPGGRKATEQLFGQAELSASPEVLDMRCGVGTTAVQWRRPQTPEARQAFLGEVCPGMLFDTVEDWLARYRRAGLAELQVTTGPFEMMTPGGFLADEGLTNSIRVMSRAMSNPVARRRMFWLMPRISRAVPFLGYVLIRGQKPAAG